LQAAQTLTQAARILSEYLQALQLRYLETLVAISAEKNSTIVFPLPMELVTPFLQAMNQER
jgi:regulator of protease activity HflC (stomatin/prohibitin superfamily)